MELEVQMKIGVKREVETEVETDRAASFNHPPKQILSTSLESRTKPIESFIESFSGGGTARLDIPLTITPKSLLEGQFLGQFG
mmetsp:Transcript_13494/g.19453  ORF Transcript_13494/g.19453 Transcript_13494/m.19453 type:complete len:83 (+) Transcript_13494:182-430(+)